MRGGSHGNRLGSLLYLYGLVFPKTEILPVSQVQL